MFLVSRPSKRFSTSSSFMLRVKEMSRIGEGNPRRLFDGGNPGIVFRGGDSLLNFADGGQILIHPALVGDAESGLELPGLLPGDVENAAPKEGPPGAHRG